MHVNPRSESSIGTERRAAFGQDHFITIAAIGVLAYISADLAHEVLGHGVGLLIAGGRSGILTTTRLIHEPRLPDPNWRWFDIGGPAINLLWAAICFVAQRSIRKSAPHARLFLWTSMTFSLLWEFGYMIKCGLTGSGDYMALIEGLTPIWAWQILILIAGVVLYRSGLSLIGADAAFIVGPPSAQARSHLVRLLLSLCIAGGVIACAGALLDPRGKIEMLRSGALSTFVAWIGLFFLPALNTSYASRRLSEDGARTDGRRSLPIIVVAGIASALFIGVLGAGIPFSI